MNELERAIRSMLQSASRVVGFQFRLWNDDFWAEVEELKKEIAKVDELRSKQA